MRDFRTQTTQVWDKLSADEEIVITNNGRPRAFLVNIPDGCFDEVLTGIRQTKAKAAAKAPGGLANRTSPEEKRAAMQEIRELLAGIDGNSIDLKQMRAERRAAKYERHD